MKKDELLITAELAQIELQDGELEKLGAEVDQMLEYFEKMNEISVEGLEPTTHALSQGNRVREDIHQDLGLSDECLERAEDLEDRFFIVPNVL
jgi:aspartyl-tRNA(Asn)/glutamyl-tRNA(Gln) amidotransferase subunit C